MSVSLLVCYFLTKIRQIWGHLHFWMRYLSQLFLRHFWNIGSLVFNLLGRAYILTFEFLCAGLNFETSDLVTFWMSGGQLLRPSGLVFSRDQLLRPLVLLQLHPSYYTIIYVTYLRVTQKFFLPKYNICSNTSNLQILVSTKQFVTLSMHYLKIMLMQIVISSLHIKWLANY